MSLARTLAGVTLTLMAVAGCSREDYQTARSGPWDVRTERVLRYSVETAYSFEDPQPKRATSHLVISFDGQGRARVQYENTDYGLFGVTERGRFIPESPNQTAPVILDFLSAFPERKVDMASGAEYSVSSTDWMPAPASALVYRSEFTCKVLSSGPTASISVLGRGLLATNDGLRTFVETYFGSSPPQDISEVVSALQTEHNYLVGSLEFDTSRGQMTGASIVYVPFPLSGPSPDQLRESLDRVELKVRLVG